MKFDLYSLPRPALAEALGAELQAAPFRAAQIFRWLYKHGAREFSEMTDIAGDLRAGLAERFEIRAPLMLECRRSADGTRKYLFEVSAGVKIETVLIVQPGRNTLCLSTQCGCAMGCRFCRTAEMGLRGNLSAGDIVRQVTGVLRDLSGECVDNLVLMGMGEPLHNVSAVADAVRILGDPQGLGVGPRKITLSTAGLVPGIEALSVQALDLSLAVSLNAATDEVRSQIMPINRVYPISALMAALRSYPLKPRRRITVEYVLLAGINDSDAELERLPAVLQGLRVKINLIPYNPNAGLPFESASGERLRHWQKRLRARGLPTSIRWSKGADIGGACGQLAVSDGAGAVQPGGGSGRGSSG